MKKQTPLTQTLTVTALMIAMRLIIEMIPSIKMGNLVQIGFGFIGAALAGVILGPYRAAVVGFFVDILGNFLRGEASNFFPGFTLTAVLGGLIYGYCLYRKKLTLPRIFVTVFIITLVINLGLNSLWIYIMTQKAFSAFMGIRILKNIISLPLNTVILYVLFRNQTMQQMIEKYRV